MNNTFDLLITGYNAIIYKGPSTYCGVTTPGGSLGLEARHEPLLTALQDKSTILYKTPSGEEKSIKIQDGLLSFKNNKCIVTISLSKK